MVEIRFKFNQEKAIEGIIYIAHKITDPTFHSINKLFYFADKSSLEKYGRFISGDEYCAMEDGPVPSSTYDLMKLEATGEHGFKADGYRISALRQPKLDLLSESDIECFDEAIRMYGNVPFWKRKQDSHDEAYDRAWRIRGNKNSVPMPVNSIAEMLEDSEELIDFLTTRHSD
jgi:uncharacterized phage-associated protein